MPDAHRRVGDTRRPPVFMTAAAVFVLLAGPLLAQDETPFDLRAELFRLAQSHDESVNPRRLRAKLSVFALELKEKLEGLEGEARPRAFAEYFFTDQLFSADPDLSSPSNFYLDRILDGRSGYCLTLSALMVCVGRKLGLPVRGVAVPRHFYVRWDDGKTVYDIETTEGGRRRDTAFYRRRGVSKAAEEAGIYLAGLSDRQVAAFLHNNEGYIHWCAGRSAEAEASFMRALELFGELPEAWLNLGVVIGERGDGKASESAFKRAARWLDGDRVLRFNRAVAAMRDGRVREGLEHAENAARRSDGSMDVHAYRHFVGATLLRKDRWDAWQATVVRAGKKLEAAGELSPGFRATYFADRELEKRVGSRVEPIINRQWRWSPPMRGTTAERFSVRWDGFVRVDEAGPYEFFLVFEQGVRLWIDGVLFIDHSSGKDDKLARETIVLGAGLHDVRVEYVALRKPNGVIFQVKRPDATSAFTKTRYFHRGD